MLASNAPFDAKGFAHVIRDLERHELLLSGSRQGDMGTSTGTNIGPLSVDQTTDPDGLGGSPVATLADLANTRASIPSVVYPISIANGGTGASNAASARTNLGLGSIATVNSPVPIANGGTGQTTSQAAAQALGCPFGRASFGSTTPGSGSTTIPAGVIRILAVLIGGGGAGGFGSGSSTTFGYIAGTSGGAVNQQILLSANGSGGGSGGCLLLSCDVVPGETLSYSIGAGGTGSTGAGGTGGDTTITLGGFGIGWAYGGRGGGRGDSVGAFSGPGQQGMCAIGATRNVVALMAAGAPGGAGSIRLINNSTGASMDVNSNYAGTGGPGGSIWGSAVSGSYGAGGKGGTSSGNGLAGNDGALFIYY